MTFRDAEQTGGCWVRALRGGVDGTLAGAGLLLDRGGGYPELHEGYNGRGPHTDTHTHRHTHQGPLNKLCGMQQCPFPDALAL